MVLKAVMMAYFQKNFWHRFSYKIWMKKTTAIQLCFTKHLEKASEIPIGIFSLTSIWHTVYKSPVAINIITTFYRSSIVISWYLYAFSSLICKEMILASHLNEIISLKKYLRTLYILTSFYVVLVPCHLSIPWLSVAENCTYRVSTAH